MQSCTKCLIDKEFSCFEFRKDSNSYRKVCRECAKAGINKAASARRATLSGKYKAQIQNANKRNVKFNLTFDEWLGIWTESGKLNERGRGASKFCMCRYNDAGAYEIGNIFIGTGKENVRDGNLGKVMPMDVRKKISIANAGKPHEWSKGEKNPMHRPEVKAKISAATGGANHYKAKGVTTPKGFFVTAKAAAEALDLNKSTVEWRAKHNKFGFSCGNNLT